MGHGTRDELEAAGLAEARGAYGEALRLLLATEPTRRAWWEPTLFTCPELGCGAKVPDLDAHYRVIHPEGHEHPCPGCGAAWTHFLATCPRVAVPIRCDECEAQGDPFPRTSFFARAPHARESVWPGTLTADGYYSEHNDAYDVKPDPVEYF